MSGLPTDGTVSNVGYMGIMGFIWLSKHRWHLNLNFNPVLYSFEGFKSQTMVFSLPIDFIPPPCSPCSVVHISPNHVE